MHSESWRIYLIHSFFSEIFGRQSHQEILLKYLCSSGTEHDGLRFQGN